MEDPNFLAAQPGWTFVPGVHLRRLSRRIDGVLVSDRAVLVFGATPAEAEGAAVDLADFHGGCQGAPVLPIVLVQGQFVVAQRPLPLPGAAPPMACTRWLLPGLLAQVARFPVVAGLDPMAWEHAPYRPVPGLLHAACALYAQHDVARLLLTHSGRGGLERTRDAIGRALAARGTRNLVVFVTGAPGAGKTLCGLDTAFAPGAQAAFLTGNPTLLHVLRAALARDAAARGMAARAARQRIDAVVQPLHAFRDHHVAVSGAPADRVLVIDEAQRCWTRAYAERKTRNHAIGLVESEPGIVLDAMGRHGGGAAVVCLVGGGQEIHAGEGGLAGWGEALAARPEWDVLAAPRVLAGPDARQRLPSLPSLRLDSGLHLRAAVRSYRAPGLVPWVEAVLGNRPRDARRLAGGLPVRLTRSLPCLREALRGRHRHGLVASSGARRLRAEGLGGILAHQDEDATASWFLDTWPDVRSSDALEVAATEFGVQGLELDQVGLCWDLDLLRTADGSAWQARAFRGSAWTAARTAEALSNRLNAYRVLMTRARQALLIWVPEGDVRDATRAPGQYGAIADYLGECGVRTLDPAPGLPDPAARPEAVLL